MNDSRPLHGRTARDDLRRIVADYDRVALALQGGGALGAYQIGVFEALSEAGVEPDWISGVSIGAINGAIIAGNPVERRLARLEEFWNTVSGRRIWAYTPDGDYFRDLRNRSSSLVTVMFGQPGFFRPRRVSPWMQPEGSEAATSYYDASELRETLERLVDFDILNDGRQRLSVGAVNVRTGNFLYFDTQRQRVGPEHVMASAALPPSMAAVRIDGEYYWDGGLVSNTPLQYLLEQEERQSALAFQVDLYSARGGLPRNMSDVMTRRKDIMFSSRTRQNTDAFARVHNLRTQLVEALKRVPPDRLEPFERKMILDAETPAVVNIVHLIYQHKSYEGHARDYEFSGTSMREHRAAGYEDTRRTLRHKDWLRRDSLTQIVTVHDMHREDPT
ncbi:patatin-like phospholipase family protein [Methylocella sp.]|uniref:patatin-like phospholipase family protein n=1 Tax=Methylocella sp. TaxID=1978226 RepID=UPI0037844213